MTVLGLDPGIARLGWGVIVNRESRNVKRAVYYGTITTTKDTPTVKRMQIIRKEIQKLLKKYKPSLVAVEKLFFSKNVKTAMQVSEIRGIILLTLAEAGVRIMECTPQQVKQAVTGYGNADKRQVQRMVQIILKLKELPKPDDAADALAMAIAGLHSQDFSTALRSARRINL